MLIEISHRNGEVLLYMVTLVTVELFSLHSVIIRTKTGNDELTLAVNLKYLLRITLCNFSIKFIYKM